MKFPNLYSKFDLSAILTAQKYLALVGALAAVSIPNSSLAATIKSNPTDADYAIPNYDHIFVIIEENQAYNRIIGSEDAPIINNLAKTYGSASNFYGEVHPSEGNYVAMIGGSTFGIHDDDAFYCKPGSSDKYCTNSNKPDYVNHTVSDLSLVDQLQAKGLSWKGYFEDIPAPGSKAIYSPEEPTATQPSQLYASKHNAFINYESVQNDPNLPSKLVGFDQLTADLNSGNVPNYSHIVANQCNEMHGLSGAFVPADCVSTPDAGRIRRGDTEVGNLVNAIQSSSIWSKGNNAIVVTWDEDNNPAVKTGVQGCCGYDPKSNANFGGGQIPTVVITNNGPRGVVDDTPYNHYSLLRTTEDAFGIYNYLNLAGDTANGVKPLTPLFTITKAVPESSLTLGLLAFGVLGIGLQRQRTNARKVV